MYACNFGLFLPNLISVQPVSFKVKFMLAGLSVEFIVELFRIILLEEKDVNLLSTMLKKAGIESRLMVSGAFVVVATDCYTFVPVMHTLLPDFPWRQKLLI